MGLKRHLMMHRQPGDVLNNALEIGVIDDPNEGGAPHKYVIYLPWDTVNEELNAAMTQHITFQQGDPAKGINGISKVALLVILKDQLINLQAGPFACEENDIAMKHLNKAIDALKKRTADRIQREVIGQEKA